MAGKMCWKSVSATRKRLSHSSVSGRVRLHSPAAKRYLNPVFAEHIRTGDKETKRPLRVLTPGGGFGRTEDFWMDDFGVALARAGYVVAINRYRLPSGINTP